MEIFTIGFAKKSAPVFFGRLKDARIARLLDIRLHNTSQLAGFTKRDDLAYFLREICAADYEHAPQLAPDEEILSAWKKKEIDWNGYETRFLALLDARKPEAAYSAAYFEVPTVLLCGEPTAAHCHRRLVAMRFSALFGLAITHL